MRSLFALPLALLAACGNDGGSSTPIDAPIDVTIDVAIDAPSDAPLDAPNDALTDAPLDAPLDAPIIATHTHFVVDEITIPANNTQARDFGMDLNGDQQVDNQLGNVLATLGSQGFDLQGAMDRAIDEGAMILLGDLGAEDLITAAPATFTIYQGTNPVPAACSSAQDTVCRKHLTGTGAFSVQSGAPVDSPLVGAISAGKLVAGPGHLSIQLVIGTSAPVTLTLLGARVELSSTAASSSGKIAGAISENDVNTRVIPAMREGFDATVMEDCAALASPPACGCAQGSTGATLIGLFDSDPANCSISVAEVQNNSLIQALFAPDVTVEGTQALSLGLRVHAVAGAFTAP